MRDTTNATNESPAGQQTAVARDDRAVAEVIGAILIFAIVIVLLVVVQVTAVPAANQQVEFEHNQRVQGDMQGLQESLARTAATGVETVTTIEAGTGYPQRFFLFNPSSPQGTVETGTRGQYVVANARATGEVGDYLNGTALAFDTRTLVYRPNYNEYRSAPRTVIDAGVLYNSNPNGRNVVAQRGTLVNGRRISLTAIQGEFSRTTSGSLTLNAVPISGPAQTVSVTSDGGPLSITVPTQLSVDDWQTLLADERESEGGYVTDVRAGPSPETVLVELRRGVTYDLRLAAVGVDSSYDTSRPPQYITDAAGNGTVIPEGGSQRLAVEVRDRYNNPVSNVTVTNTTALAGASVTTVGTNRTDAQGRVTLEYTAPPDVGRTLTDRVEVAFGGGGTEQREATLLVSVFDADGSGGGDPPNAGTGNPLNPGINVQLRDANALPGGGNCASRTNDCDASIRLENVNSATGWAVEGVRVSVYGSQGYQPPQTVTFSNTQGGSGVSASVGADFVGAGLDDISPAGTPGDAQTYHFRFGGFPRSQDGVQRGDVFVVELLLEDDDGNEFSVTYYVAPY